MSEVVYCSHVRIERVKGPVRRAYLPAETKPVIFGVHGAVAEHYKVPPAVLEPHATTLDYIVAAAAGSLPANSPLASEPCRPRGPLHSRIEVSLDHPFR